MIKVYAKVVADLLHPGHLEFFKHAKLLGDHLTVCVVPDERVTLHKGRTPIFSTAERAVMVESCRFVDAVIIDGPKVISLDFMNSGEYEIYAFGARNDQELATKLRDCEELPESRKARVPYSPQISSTIIIERILERYRK